MCLKEKLIEWLKKNGKGCQHRVAKDLGENEIKVGQHLSAYSMCNRLDFEMRGCSVTNYPHRHYFIVKEKVWKR